jgi:hypothetical protein
MKLDGSYHEFSHTPATSLHLWVEVISDVGDIDGQPMTYGLLLMSTIWGDDAHAIDALHLPAAVPGQPTRPPIVEDLKYAPWAKISL